MVINLRFGLFMVKVGWVGVIDVFICLFIVLVLLCIIEVLGNMVWGY